MSRTVHLLKHMAAFTALFSHPRTVVQFHKKCLAKRTVVQEFCHVESNGKAVLGGWEAFARSPPWGTVPPACMAVNPRILSCHSQVNVGKSKHDAMRWPNAPASLEVS